LCRRAELFLGSFFVAPHQVFADGSRKQHILLQHHADAVAQILQRIITHIDAVHQNFALIGIIQPGNHLHQRRFAGAGGADDSHHLTGLRGEADSGKHPFLAVLVITERNVAELHLALCNGEVLLCGAIIGQIDRRLQYLVDAAQGGHGARALHDNHGKHHQGHQDLRHISNKRGQVADFHLTDSHLLPSEPDDSQRSQIHRQHHDRHCSDDYPKCTQAVFHQLCICLSEFFLFKLTAHKRFDHTHIRQILLNRRVDTIDLFLHQRKARKCRPDHKSKRHDQRGNHDGQNDRKAGAQRNRHHQRADQHSGSAQHHAHSHVDQVLHLGDIVCQSGNQRAGTEGIDVRK